MLCVGYLQRVQGTGGVEQVQRLSHHDILLRRVSEDGVEGP
jgi:hypothetical protein